MVTVTELNRAPDGRFESLEATDEINTANISAATERQILAFSSSPPNLEVVDQKGIWEEDDNSPLTSSDGTSATINLANSSDYVKLEQVPQTGGQADCSFQINNDTGNNYNNIDNTGSQTTGNDRFQNVTSGFVGGGPVYIRAGDDHISLSALQNGADFGTVAGDNNNITAPITDITILPEQSDGAKFKVFTADFAQK